MAILLILYIVVGYWAAGQTIYANKIVFYHRIGDLFMQRLIYAITLGWVLIPWALIKRVLSRR